VRGAQGQQHERAAAVIVPALAWRLRLLALESCINLARFERHLSFSIDRAVVAMERER
jgi:hypothetical protein